MARFFRVPFGISGNREAVPDEAPADGSVNYTTGYPRDYERNPVTDPSAKMIERTHFNSVLFDVTDALRVLQSKGFPDFITPQDNGGTAFSYQVGATVSYAGKNYISRIANNTSLPTVSTAWIELIPFDKSAESATSQEVVAGTGDRFVRSDFLRAGVRATTLSGFNLAAGDISANDTVVGAFGKTQRQLNALKEGAVKSVTSGSPNVTIDNSDPLNPKISVAGADIGSAPTKPSIANGDGVVISDSADSNAVKRVAWSVIQTMLDGKYLPSVSSLGLTAKASLANADQFLIADSADQNKAKGFTATRLYSAVHEANKNKYTEAGVAVPLTGGAAMSGELQTPQVRLGGVAIQDFHAPTFKQVRDNFLHIVSPSASGNLTIRNGLARLEPSAMAATLLEFARMGLPVSSYLSRQANGDLSFNFSDIVTGDFLREVLRLKQEGGVEVFGGAKVNGTLIAEGGIQGSWMTLSENQPINPLDAVPKKYVDSKTAGAMVVFSGTNNWEPDYVVGTILLAQGRANANANVTVRQISNAEFRLQTGANQLTGTWRARGASRTHVESTSSSVYEYTLVQKVSN